MSIPLKRDVLVVPTLVPPTLSLSSDANSPNRSIEQTLGRYATEMGNHSTLIDQNSCSHKIKGVWRKLIIETSKNAKIQSFQNRIHFLTQQLSNIDQNRFNQVIIDINQCIDEEALKKIKECNNFVSLHNISRDIETQILSQLIKNRLTNLETLLNTQNIFYEPDSWRDIFDLLQLLKIDVKLTKISNTNRIEIKQTKSIFQKLCKSFVNRNFVNGLLEVAEACNHTFCKARVLQLITSNLTTYKQKEQALEIINTFQYHDHDSLGVKWCQLEAFKKVVEELVTSAQIDRALEIASRIPIQESELELTERAKIECDFTNPELQEKILDIISNIEGNKAQGKILIALAKKLITPQHVDKALDILMTVIDPKTLAAVLLVMEEKITTPLQVRKAFNAAISITDDELLLEALKPLVKKFGILESIQDVLDLASTMFGGDAFRLAVLQAIGCKLKEPEEINQALEIIESFEGNWGKLDAFKTIVNSLRDPEQVQKCLEIIEKIPQDRTKTYALQVLAHKLATAELVLKALEIVSSIRESWSQSAALQRIAPQITTDEEIRVFFEITNLIQDDDWSKSDALEAIANHLTTDEQIQKFTEISITIERHSLKLDIFQPFIEELTTDEKITRFLEIIRTIKDSSLQLDILQSVINRLTTDGHIQQSLDLVDRMEDNEKKSATLEIIYKKLEEIKNPTKRIKNDSNLS